MFIKGGSIGLPMPGRKGPGDELVKRLWMSAIKADALSSARDLRNEIGSDGAAALLDRALPPA